MSCDNNMDVKETTPETESPERYNYSYIVIIVAILVIGFLLYISKAKWETWFTTGGNQRDGLHSRLQQVLTDAKQHVFVLIKKAEQSSVNGIETHILNKLGQNLYHKKVALTEQPWRPGLASEGTPVIVFCVYSSRLGVDIESAMRGVEDYAKIVLVVLHPKLRSLLRGDLSSEEDLLDRALLNRMSAIAHFAFSDHEGLYTCHQNDTGLEKLLKSI